MVKELATVGNATITSIEDETSVDITEVSGIEPIVKDINKKLIQRYGV